VLRDSLASDGLVNALAQGKKLLLAGEPVEPLCGHAVALASLVVSSKQGSVIRATFAVVLGPKLSIEAPKSIRRLNLPRRASMTGRFAQDTMVEAE
jgi:hypothetical protein